MTYGSCFAAQRKEVQARAVFYPLMGLGSAVNMCYRTLYIGTGQWRLSAGWVGMQHVLPGFSLNV